MSFQIEVEITKELFEPPYYHIHHGEMLRFLERARKEFMASIGHPLEKYFAKQRFWVVSAVNIQYKREVVEGRYLITVENPELLDRRRAQVKQRIINEKGKDAVVATVEFMCIAGELHRAIAIDEDFKEAFLESVDLQGIEV